MCCGSGGERISRHNALRDAIFDTAVVAGLGPVMEGRFCLPGNDQRPADVLVPNWTGGKDAAIDVKATPSPPLKLGEPLILKDKKSKTDKKNNNLHASPKGVQECFQEP